MNIDEKDNCINCKYYQKLDYGTHYCKKTNTVIAKTRLIKECETLNKSEKGW